MAGQAGFHDRGDGTSGDCSAGSSSTAEPHAAGVQRLWVLRGQRPELHQLAATAAQVCRTRCHDYCMACCQDAHTLLFLSKPPRQLLDANPTVCGGLDCRRDFYKLMQKHRIVLRFGCRFHETAQHRLTPADKCGDAYTLLYRCQFQLCLQRSAISSWQLSDTIASEACNTVCRERSFVLSYFCGDDTLSIFEPPQRNTGITGGRFLERARVSFNQATAAIKIVGCVHSVYHSVSAPCST